jgi:hypothetical protein
VQRSKYTRVGASTSVTFDFDDYESHDRCKNLLNIRNIRQLWSIREGQAQRTYLAAMRSTQVISKKCLFV